MAMVPSPSPLPCHACAGGADVGDTVTLFCLLDFFSNKKWSKETLEQCERSRRAAMARKPRDAASPSQPVDKRCRKERWQAKREALVAESTA